MHPGQKFAELEDVLNLAKEWIDESEAKGPYVEATYSLLTQFRNMIDGYQEWETCFTVKERIEKAFLEGM